jgi:hypothetical protein
VLPPDAAAAAGRDQAARLRPGQLVRPALPSAPPHFTFLLIDG